MVNFRLDATPRSGIEAERTDQGIGDGNRIALRPECGRTFVGELPQPHDGTERLMGDNTVPEVHSVIHCCHSGLVPDGLSFRSDTGYGQEGALIFTQRVNAFDRHCIQIDAELPVHIPDRCFGLKETLHFMADYVAVIDIDENTGESFEIFGRGGNFNLEM